MYKILAANCVFLSVLVYLWFIGILDIAYANDILFILPAILVSFIVGQASNLFFKNKIINTMSEICVSLGFLGTVYGVYIAVSAVGTETIQDTSQLSVVISELLRGVGAALWTTATGIFFAVWLRMVESMRDEEETI